MNTNHTSTLLHLLDNDFRIQLRPDLFIVRQNSSLQLLSDPTNFHDDANSSNTPSICDIFPFNDELSMIHGNFTGRRFYLVSSSNDFVRVHFQNGEIRRTKKRFAGIQLDKLRRSPRIAAKTPKALQRRSPDLIVREEVDMNEVRRWIQNHHHQQVHSPESAATSIHTVPRLPSSEMDQIFCLEEAEDSMTWEDSQQPWEIEQDEQQEIQTQTQAEPQQPSRRIHWPKTVVTSVHTIPNLRRSEVRRAEEDKQRMGRDDCRRHWDLELDEDPQAQAQSESGCCVS
mmetsp:Transcript_7644/g.15776  ORF Transcript_7644/g.15776 Transcript_7644/m.15776 type:complete len:285 (+) Transcript_7644:173-1027(+)